MTPDPAELAKRFTIAAAEMIEALDDALEAVNAERNVIAEKAREWAGHYSPGSDGRNTFVLFAEWIERRGVDEQCVGRSDGKE